MPSINDLLKNISTLYDRKILIDSIINTIKTPSTVKTDDQMKVIIDDIPVPKISYSISETRSKKWIAKAAECGEDVKNVAEKIISVTSHVSFTEFVNNLKKSIEKFENAIGNNDFILLIPVGNVANVTDWKTKSNYWVSQMTYHLLNKKPIKIVSHLDENDYSLNSTKPTNILICDDGIYSGMQMSGVTIPGFITLTDRIKKNYKNLKFYLNIHIVCPYISEQGIKTVSWLNIGSGDSIDLMQFINTLRESCPVIIHFSIIMKTVSELLDPSMYNIANTNFNAQHGRIPIFFDHRLPDFLSSLFDIYHKGFIKCNNATENVNNLIQGCPEKIADKDLCPIPPYKNRTDTTHVKLLTPEQFLQKYK